MDLHQQDFRPGKRKLSEAQEDGQYATSQDALNTFSEPISPPPSKRQVVEDDSAVEDVAADQIPEQVPQTNNSNVKTIPSPIQLMHVKGLPASDNQDTVKLEDILGDPLIKECWAFNYLIDVDYLMSCFDEDVRELVDVTIVHGSWRREDTNRARIEEAVKRWKQVKEVRAWIPDQFGTHHSKMLILIKHDDLAQVVILTRNFIPRDSTMCQAVWRSPLLPLSLNDTEDSSRPDAIGARFKYDLISYLQTYGPKLKDLIRKLYLYDFSDVRAALIASTPGRQNLRLMGEEEEVLWGWPGLKRILGKIPMQSTSPNIVVQVSSVATLGIQDSWLLQTLFRALSSHAKVDENQAEEPPKFSVVFPTAEEIRRSIDGYACGGSIHMKTSSAQQVKQLAYLRPLLCHWAADHLSGSSSIASESVREAGRKRTGPHIKTYLRFADEHFTRLDYAMMTSSNLSKQAWGTDASSEGEVKVSSYEIGVVVWPALWKDSADDDVEMVPTFKTDLPQTAASALTASSGEKKVVVGIRMPYDLPLVSYSSSQKPWCQSMPDHKPDNYGRIWMG